MKETKLTALFMALLLCGANVVACGSGEGVGAQDTTAAGTESGEGTTESTALTADIPDKDYGGYEFRILAAPKDAHSTLDDEVWVETENGDIMNDAVFKRNTMTEEKLNIKIKKIESSSATDDVAKSVMAGDDAFDASIMIVSNYNAAITSGYLLELDKLSYIDTAKPWWMGSVINDFSIADKRFLLFGDMLWNDKETIWALCFNKVMAEENQLEDPYKLVRDGKWTIAKLEEQCKNISKDLDGNTVMDYKDQWGLLGSKTAGIGLITSCGVMTADTDKNGMTFALDSARSVSALDTIYDLVHGENMMLRAEDISGVSDIWTEIINVFREGRALYRISVMKDITGLRDMEDEFGILPMPKLDENQDEYYTTYQGWTSRSIAVPVTAADPERTGIILEYMASVSTDTMLKAYYDTTLQRKVSRDDESAEMLDIIFDSVTTDVALAFELGGIRASLINMINAASNTNASSIASIKTSMQEQLNTVYDNVSKLD